VVEARGAALLPGLHDHHLHLLALAAARRSVQCGPPAVTDAAALARALRAAPGAGWLRGVGYHESVAGELDRHKLDVLAPERPVRVQHASGKAWFLNSAGIRALTLGGGPLPEGAERGVDGEPTGRFFRVDDWLRGQLARADAPDLGPVSNELAGFGITGVTDATPGNDAAAAGLFADAVKRGVLGQRVRLMGSEALGAVAAQPRVSIGELKILLDEDRLPDLDPLVDRVRASHRLGRGVAFHCVSHIELVYALHVLEAARMAGRAHDAGAAVPRDRIEHASVTPPDLLPHLRSLGVTVVTQPALVAERGDRYLAEAEPDELPHLYRLRSFLRAGVPLGLSSDAPYGGPDPWAAMRAAISRRTACGVVVDATEALAPEAALAGFLGSPERPGGPVRAVRPGAPADLCLLDRPWCDARERLEAGQVRLTIAAGTTIFEH
jgi:predicted amidohydrolase YtcJ